MDHLALALSEARILKNEWLHSKSDTKNPKEKSGPITKALEDKMRRNAYEIIYGQWLEDIHKTHRLWLWWWEKYQVNFRKWTKWKWDSTRFDTIQEGLSKSGDHVQPINTLEKRKRRDHIMGIRIDPNKVKEWLYRAATGDHMNPFSIELVGAALPRIKDYLKRWRSFPKEYAWDNWYVHSNENRILYWNAPIRRHPTLVNTSCRIIAFNAHSADFFDDAYKAHRQLSHITNNIRTSLVDIQWYETELKKAREMIMKAEKKNDIHVGVKAFSDKVYEILYPLTSSVPRIEYLEDGMTLKIVRWARKSWIRFSPEQWRVILEAKEMVKLGEKDGNKR